MSIPKKVLERLEKYSSKLGKSVEDLSVEYKTYLEAVNEKFPTLDDVRKSQKALESLVNAYRRKHGDFRRSSAEMYEGWIDGTTPLRDQVQEKLRKVSYLLRQEGKQELLLKELIDENGTPIDDRPSIFGRRDNPNFRKPLANAPPTYIKTIYGMFRLKGETGSFKPFQMTFFEEAAERLRIKTNIPCEFRASAGQKPGQLFGRETTKFFPITVDWDMNLEYEKSGSLLPCKEIEARMQSRNWDDRDIRVKADVVNINPNPLNDRGDRVMGIADLSLDLDETISCFVPEHVQMNFGQDSKIVLIARARAYNNKPSTNVYGIWPVPGEISFDDLQLIEDDDIIDVGWVDPDSSSEVDFDLDLEEK